MPFLCTARKSVLRPGFSTAGGSATIAFQSALDSFIGWDDVGAAWSIASDGGGSFGRCAYDGSGIGTAQYQLIKYMPVLGIREYWIAFDMRQSITTATAKTLKFFGIRSGTGNNTYSNNTWNNGYNAAFDGVMYGNSPTGGNDATCVMKYTNLSFDDRSTENVVFRKNESLFSSTSWRRFKFHWKQNSSGAVSDGEVQVYLDDVLWLDVRNLFNRGDDSQGFEYMSFGDYTQSTTPFNLDVRNVALSFDGMPA